MSATQEAPARGTPGKPVRAELRKTTSTRLWWGLLLGGVVFTALSAGLTAGFAGVSQGNGAPATPGLDNPETLRSVYGQSAFGGMYVFTLILGIVAMTGEYRHQTITPTFLVSPRRERVVAAKLTAQLLVGLVYGVVAVLVALGVGVVVVGLRGYPLGLGADGVLPSMLLAVVTVAVWSLIGIGLGTLIRSQVAAIVVAILVTFLLEPLLSLALNALDASVVTKFFPSNASSALMSPGDAYTEVLPWWAGGIVLAAYAVVFAGLGLLVSVRRDVS